MVRIEIKLCVLIKWKGMEVTYYYYIKQNYNFKG